MYEVKIENRFTYFKMEAKLQRIKHTFIILTEVFFYLKARPAFVVNVKLPAFKKPATFVILCRSRIRCGIYNMDPAVRPQAGILGLTSTLLGKVRAGIFIRSDTIWPISSG